jgi:thiosulfate/3-mercaptopyruvate sulfurtransferase
MRTLRHLPVLLLFIARVALASPESARAQDLMQPEELTKLLAGPAAKRPVLVQVGFEVLYRGAHIPGSIYAGPDAKPEGIAALKKALGPLPRKSAIVLYCGCCPWTDCPNVRPAFRTAKAMGFENVKLLVIRQNLKHDWIDRGFPVQKSPG